MTDLCLTYLDTLRDMFSLRPRSGPYWREYSWLPLVASGRPPPAMMNDSA
jgi:hypothetical protein